MAQKPNPALARKPPVGLYQALQAYNVSKVKTLLKPYGSAEVKAGSDIINLMNKTKSYFSTFDYSPLEAAVCVGNYNICKFLIEDGALMLRTNKNRNILRHALERGHFKVAQLLISKGASVWMEFEDKLPLCLALNNKNCTEETVKAIVDAGFPPNEIIHKLNNQTALHVAVQMNHLSIVEYLLSEVKVETNVKDLSGKTPLHYATQNNNQTIIDMLVIYGAKIDAECNANFTSIFYAISTGKTSIVNQFLSQGTDIHQCSGQTMSLTPLHFATILCQLKIVKLLLEREADVHRRTPETGELAIHSAARIQCPDIQNKISLHCILEMFIKEKSDLNLRDNFGWTPLQVAVKANNINLAKSLISNGSQLNEGVEGSEGSKVPFHTVAATCNKELINLCLEYGADCCKKNDEGLYPANITLVSAMKESGTSSESYSFTEKDTECLVVSSKDTQKKEYSNVIKLFIRHGFPFELLTRIKWACGQRPQYSKEITYLISGQLELFSGVRNNQLKYVRKAIKQGAEVKSCSTGLSFPVHDIASKGNEYILKIFLMRGVNVNVLNAEGKTPLHLAAEAGHYESCLVLLEYGAVYNPRSPKFPKTPLQLAQEKNREDCVSLFSVVGRNFRNMKKGYFNKSMPFNEVFLPFLNCCDRTGSTLLHVALKNNFMKVAQEVIEMKIFLNFKGE